MNRELRRILNRNLQRRQEATAAAVESLGAQGISEFALRDWSRSIEAAYNDQWCSVQRHTDAGWNWPEIYRSHKSPDDHLYAILSGNRISALGLLRTSRTSVQLAFFEGDPRPDCPLKGVRTAIALEFSAIYGQNMGCEELWGEPVNQAVKDLYCEVYGFEEVKPRKGLPFVKRSLRS